MNNRNNASTNFNEMYEPEKQHFNLDNRRAKNIAIIEALIAKLGEVKDKYAIKKRNSVADITNEDGISKKAKEKMIDRDFEYLNEEEMLELQQVELEITNEMKRQAKMLLILKDNKDIYNFYMQVVNNPLKDTKYAEIESNVYREFMLANPRIENIIIAYSELNNKNQSPVEPEQPVEPVQDDEDDELDKLLKEIEKLLKELEDKISIGETDVAKINKLISMYEKLSEVDKNIFKHRVILVIRKSNVIIQNQKQAEIFENEKADNYSVGTIVTEFLGYSIDKIRGTRLFKDRYQEKYNLARANKDAGKMIKYRRLMLDQETVSGAKLMANRNRINTLSFLNHNWGLTALNSRRLNKSEQIFGNKLSTGLQKLSDNETVAASRLKARHIIEQYIDLAALSKDYKNSYLKGINFVNDCFGEGSILVSEKISYIEQLKEIYKYRLENNGEIYLFDNKNVINMVRYYDSDKYNELDLPYIKRK